LIGECAFVVLDCFFIPSHFPERLRNDLFRVKWYVKP